jgi:hypothetical protein
VGVDIDPRAFVAENALASVEIIEGNAFASALSVGTFDLTPDALLVCAGQPVCYGRPRTVVLLQ